MVRCCAGSVGSATTVAPAGAAATPGKIMRNDDQFHKAFPDPLIVRVAHATSMHGTRMYILHEPFRVNLPSWTGVVPAEYVTDFYSIPRWAQLIGLRKDEVGLEAAVVHDWLISSRRCTRAMANLVLLEGILICGLSAWRSNLIYAGCVLYAWWSGKK